RSAWSFLRKRMMVRIALVSKPLPLASAKTSLMSSEIVFFSSSRRSMRSMKARSWPAATVWLLSVISSDIITPSVMFVQARRATQFASRAAMGMRVGCPTQPEESMVLWAALFERCLLVRRSLCLIARTPFIVWHAIDDFSRRFLVERDPRCLSCLPIPVGEAVPAKTGQVHQIDVLNIGTLAQMRDQASK